MTMEPSSPEHTAAGKNNLLVVCGPTASGKTALAVALASRLNGEIISADSRQVYRGLDIGSGKDLHEYGSGNHAIPYHLIDIADPFDIYTLYNYQHDFYRVFDEISRRNRLPILCGGTGLYIEAVLRGYAVPPVPEDRELRLRLMEKEHVVLEAMLREIDTVRYEATDRSSKKRIVRSIEVALHLLQNPGLNNAAAGVSMTHPPHPLVFCTRWDRTELHRRIDVRLDERLSCGMIDEVRSLRERGLPDERLAMLGMEYKYITLYLRGEIGCSEMKESLRRSIYQLSKRQETYFRGMERRSGITIQWIENADVNQVPAKIRKP